MYISIALKIIESEEAGGKRKGLRALEREGISEM